MKKEDKKTNSKKDPMSILVVGDWFVDEHSIVGTEYSETSSHVGKQHYRSKISDVKTRTLSLTGAGGIARLLHSIEYEDGTKPNIDIRGLGYWDPKDTRLMASFIWHDDKITNQTRHTLSGMYIKESKKGGKPSFCDSSDNCLKCKEEQCGRLYSLSKKEAGTQLVSRIYSQRGMESSHLLLRCDYNFCKEPGRSHKWLKKHIKEAAEHWENVKAVIVVDHRKGCITNELIECLIETEPLNSARWYARIKDPEVEWLEIIKEKLKLLVTGPMLLELESDSWFLGQHLSIGALSWLCDKAGKELKKPPNSSPSKWKFHEKDKEIQYAVIAFHNNNNMAAFIPHELNGDLSKKKKQMKNPPPVIFSTNKVPGTPLYKVGRASVLFSSLIASMEGFESKNKRKECELSSEYLENALRRAYAWCKEGEKDLRDVPFDPKIDLDFRRRYKKWWQEQKGDFQIRDHSLIKEVDSWNMAHNYKRLGIVKSDKSTMNPKQKLQLWRAWSPIKGYISLSDDNRKAISNLKNVVTKFRSDQYPQRSLSCLLISAPGLGKSYLVERLSAQMDIEYREFNITQLASIDDLMTCFDTISSIQTQKPGEPLMVFWDEINAPLGGQNVYSYFLGPIWNGVYRRGGQTFQLRPCIWIFAGTEDITRVPDKGKTKKSEISKGSDFISRINGPIIKLSPLTDQDDASKKKKGKRVNMEEMVRKVKIAEMEQLYMAVSLVKRRFPDTLQISDKILGFFKEVEPLYGVRSIEFIISQFKNMNRGKLGMDSLPDIDKIEMWIKNYETIDRFVKQQSNQQEKFARIYSEPPD